jgi:hypothetical protein
MPEDLLKFGLIPEFIGRLPVIVTLSALTSEDLVRVLTEPKNAVTRQFQKFLSLDKVELVFTPGALRAAADVALDRKTGARALRSIVEEALLAHDPPHRLVHGLIGERQLHTARGHERQTPRGHPRDALLADTDMVVRDCRLRHDRHADPRGDEIGDETDAFHLDRHPKLDAFGACRRLDLVPQRVAVGRQDQRLTREHRERNRLGQHCMQSRRDQRDKVFVVKMLDVQARILQHFRDNKMTWDHPPIVGVGPHSGDPHYEPRPGDDGKIGRDQFVLVDLWGKLDRPRAVVSDLTRTGFTGNDIPEKYVDVFTIVAAARDAAIARVKSAFANGEDLRGWQVDRACRDVIEKAGYGPDFTHRTGHSIGEDTHGNGANMDDLETHDERKVLPRTCFSIEPGIYLPDFGVRSEVNVFVDKNRKVHVTGGDPQTEIARIV